MHQRPVHEFVTPWLSGLILTLGCGFCLHLSGQSFQVRSWHVEDGLPDGTVTALAQTPEGYLWVGSRKGLARFDGLRFVQVSGAGGMSLGEPAITALLAARDGTLWIASESGLVTQFSNGEFRVRYAPPSPSGVAAHPSPSDEARWFAFSPLAMDGEGIQNS